MENTSLYRSSTLIQRNPSQIFTKVDNEIVMLNSDFGEYIALNSVASRIWEIIEDPMPISEIIEKLLEEFEISHDECLNDTLNYIAELREQKLLI